MLQQLRSDWYQERSDADKNKEKWGKNYDLLTANEVAAIVIGDTVGSTDKRDIIGQEKNGDYARID